MRELHDQSEYLYVVPRGLRQVCAVVQVYILRVERENQRVPTYVFRLFAEFVEFRDKLAAMFPLVTWSNFSTRWVA